MVGILMGLIFVVIICLVAIASNISDIHSEMNAVKENIKYTLDTIEKKKEQEDIIKEYRKKFKKLGYDISPCGNDYIAYESENSSDFVRNHEIHNIYRQFIDFKSLQEKKGD